MLTEQQPGGTTAPGRGSEPGARSPAPGRTPACSVAAPESAPAPVPASAPAPGCALTTPSSPFIAVGATRVYGLPVDAATRCVHWCGAADVVALSHPCCGRFYPCAACHDAVAGHARQTWPRDAPDSTVLCGACAATMTPRAYLRAMRASARPACPACGHAFNPGCARHTDMYFGPPAHGDAGDEGDEGDEDRVV